MPTRKPHTPAVRAAELRDLGYAAFRANHIGRARQHFERAAGLSRMALGAQHPDTLTTLSDLGAACAVLGDYPAARAAHEAALHGRRLHFGDSHPDVAASLHNLGALCHLEGDPTAAEAHHREALAIWRATLADTHPLLAKALACLSALASARGDHAEAVALARQAHAVREQNARLGDPSLIDSLDDLATALARSGDAAGAEETWSMAIFRSQALRAPTAPLWNRIGMARRQRGDLPQAAAAFTTALAEDPDFTAARHNLATTLTRLGDIAQATSHRNLALRQQSLFTQPGPSGAPSVLILSISDEGNVPLEHLLPEAKFTRLWWFIDHARAPARHPLPPYDVVLNGVGDPDMAGQAEPKIAAFLAACRKPVLNRPDRIAGTRRDRIADLLAGIDGVVVPRLHRIDGYTSIEDLIGQATQAGLALPVLLRPAGSHGGAGLRRIDDASGWATCPPHAAAAWYLGPFLDCRAPDGYFRKYRMVYVGGRALPYHLAISPNWLVHYATADMEAHDWKRAEELHFLADPRAALGARAADAIAKIGQRLALDYCGIDFTLGADGQIIVFEANATMLIHPEAETGVLAYKNEAVEKIVSAMRDLVNERAAAT